MQGCLGVFPGQGLAPQEVLDALPETGELYERSRDVLGYEVRNQVLQVVRRGARVLPTWLAQPAIVVASVASFLGAPKKATVLLGHSVGEFPALVGSGWLSFEDALKVVKVRGEAMEQASRRQEGGMTAVLGLTLEQATAVAGETGVVVACHNSPSEVVLAGPREKLAQAAQLVRQGGGRALLLKVPGAFHSPSMAPAAEELARVLAEVDLEPGSLPVLSGVTARPYESPEEVRRLLVRQLTSTIRFCEAVGWAWEQGIREWHDFGPGRVAGSLAAKTFAVLEKEGESLGA